MKYSLVPILILFLVDVALGQNKYERESRIDREQFPKTSFKLIEDYLIDAKRIRFYHETDGKKMSYEAKFKKGKLHYSIEFNEDGVLEDVEFIITEDDIPESTWTTIIDYLKITYSKYRIRKIQQQHPLHNQDSQKTIHDALQNLLLPYINYEVVFATKEKKDFQTYEALFDADGQLIKIRKSFPPSYDHVLY